MTKFKEIKEFCQKEFTYKLRDVQVSNTRSCTCHRVLQRMTPKCKRALQS